MCKLDPVLQPDAKLQKMLTFIKIVLIINLISSFLRLFIRPSDLLFDLLCSLFLYLAYNSVYFLYMAVYIIFCLINAVYLFISSATIFQMLIQDTIGDSLGKVPLVLSISLYLLVFYIFAIIYTYPAYREMKAQLMESSGGARPNLNSSRDEERPAPQNTNESSNRAFQAFSGRGVVVGGEAQP